MQQFHGQLKLPKCAASSRGHARVPLVGWAFGLCGNVSESPSGSLAKLGVPTSDILSLPQNEFQSHWSTAMWPE